MTLLKSSDIINFPGEKKYSDKTKEIIKKEFEKIIEQKGKLIKQMKTKDSAEWNNITSKNIKYEIKKLTNHGVEEEKIYGKIGLGKDKIKEHFIYSSIFGEGRTLQGYKKNISDFEKELLYLKDPRNETPQRTYNFVKELKKGTEKKFNKIIDELGKEGLKIEDIFKIIKNHNEK